MQLGRAHSPLEGIVQDSCSKYGAHQTKEISYSIGLWPRLPFVLGLEILQTLPKSGL